MIKGSEKRRSKIETLATGDAADKQVEDAFLDVTFQLAAKLGSEDEQAIRKELSDWLSIICTYRSAVSLRLTQLIELFALFAPPEIHNHPSAVEPSRLMTGFGESDLLAGPPWIKDVPDLKPVERPPFWRVAEQERQRHIIGNQGVVTEAGTTWPLSDE